MITSNGSTMKWKEVLKEHFEKQIKIKEYIKNYYANENLDADTVGIHIGIFTEPFLSLLIAGEKTMESRFSINRIAPFQKVKQGDIVYIKKSGGMVCGYFIVGKSQYVSMPSRTKLVELKNKFSKSICSDSVENFWESKQNAQFISLLSIKLIHTINPLEIDKRDRTAWVTIRSSTNLTENNTIWKS